MQNIKSTIRKLLIVILGSKQAYKLIGRYNDLEILTAYWFSPTYRESVRRLRMYKNKHVGERCFIIGNGPSLKKMDLSPLKHEYTFGLNRIYLLFDSIGFATTYFVSMTSYVIEQCAGDIIKLPCPKFINWDSRSFIPSTSDVIFIHPRANPKFCTDIDREGFWSGATVTYVAMQLAYYMGFQQVILIGVDHSFQTKGFPGQLVTSEGDDPNHFCPEYFGKGFKWSLPDLETSEIAYKLAKHQFELSGREILDATVGGKLQVFSRVDYTDIVGKSNY